MRPTAKNNVQETYPTKLAKTHYKSDSNLADPREKNPRSSDDQTPWPPVDQYAYQNHPWSKGNPALAAHSRGFHSEWVLLQPHENLEPRNSLMEDLDPCIWRDKAAERDRIQSRQSLPEPIYSSISDEDDPSTDQGSRQIKRKRFEPPNSPLAKSHHGHTDNAHAMLKGSTQAYHSMFNVGNEDAESDEAAEERMRQFMLQKANSSTTSSSTTTVGSVSRKKPAWITRIQNRKKDSSSSSDEAANRRSQRRPRQMIANLEVQPRGDPQGLKTRKPTNMVANGSNSLQTKNSSHLLSSQQENSQKYDRDRHRCSDRIPEPMKSKPGTAFLVQNTGNTSSFSNSSHAGNDPVLYLSSPSLSIRSNAKGYSSPFQRGEQLELRSIRKPNRDPSQQMTITVSMVHPNRKSSTSTSGAGSTRTVSPIKLSSNDDSSSTSRTLFKPRSKKRWRPSSVHVSSTKFNNYFQLEGGSSSAISKFKQASKSESNFYDLFERTRDSRLLAHSSETVSGTIMNSIEYGDGSDSRSYFEDTPSSPGDNLDFEDHFRLTKDFGDFQTYSESPHQRLEYSNIPRTPGFNVEDQSPTTAVPLGMILPFSSSYSLYNEKQEQQQQQKQASPAGCAAGPMEWPGKTRKSNAKFNERKKIRKETRI